MSRATVEPEADPEPVCEFGRPSPVDPEWDGEDHCAGCYAATMRYLAEFEANVAAGVYDRHGYAPVDLRDAHRRFPLLVKMDS